MSIRRGDVFVTRLDPVEGHEQQGPRPTLVLSDDRFNARGMVIAVPMTRTTRWAPPLEIELGIIGGKPSYARPAQVRAISTARLERRLGGVSQEAVERCLDALLWICGRRPKQKADNDG